MDWEGEIRSKCSLTSVKGMDVTSTAYGLTSLRRLYTWKALGD